MKQYTKLKVPKDSAWDDTRFKWGKYVHWRIRYFFKGIWNIIRWAPTLYKDKDWDDYYLTKIIQKKIEHQRKCLVNANRHTEIDRDNKYMTLILNLIEREHEDYYALEKYNYCEQRLVTDQAEDGSGYNVEIETVWENLDEYLAKYPTAVRAVKKAYPEHRNLKDKHSLSMFVGIYNQERCRNLIFEILKRQSACWWD